MSPLHIDPVDPHLHFIANPESLMSPFAKQAVLTFMIAVIVIVKARYSNQPLHKNILQFNKEPENSLGSNSYP